MGHQVSDDGTDLATRVREHVEASARGGSTPGEIGAALWADRIVTDRVEARRIVVELADDIIAWRLAGRREFRVKAYRCATGVEKLSPGQAAAQAEWGRQHAGWSRKAEVDPAKQGATEQREGAAAKTLKAV